MRFWSIRISGLALTAAMLICSPGSVAAVRGETQAPAVNHAAPNFSRTTFDRKKIVLSSFRGKVVLLNFWASWCGPCLVEIPHFVDWQRRYGRQGLQVIGISMDDEERPALAVYRKFAVNYPMLMGDARLGELYGGILGLPVTFLIDRLGIVRFEYRGAIQVNALQAEIQALLRSH